MAISVPKETAQRQATGEQGAARQIIGFSFYRVDSAWRQLPKDVKRKQAAELCAVVNTYGKRLLVLTYSLVGLKPDVDFLIWRVGTSLEQLQEMSSAIWQTEIAGHLSLPYHYLSMTKRSTYVDKLDPEHQDARRFITPAHSRYLFVYPFLKTREWYLLPLEERQAMMDEHIRVGSQYPSVKLHTTYSFGLDDQEFLVAFETDYAQDFLDLVMALRETKGSRYTLRDTPIFTCVAKSMSEIVKEFGTPT